jgi:3-methyladenine DNA glycosylase AlkD
VARAGVVMAASKTPRLLLDLRRELARAGTPERAKGAQAYMKSTMPYHGVALPDVRVITKAAFAKLDLGDAPTWRRHVLALFDGAKFREEWYAALTLAADRRARSFQTLEALPMYEHMIVRAAWWDVVDDLAGRRFAEILRHEPRAMRKTMLAWSRDANMWKRRSSIICQLRFKEATDLELLYACIEPSLESREFFLRKAIGWALRELAWSDPQEVVRYVRANRERLSNLSKREALKNVVRSGLISEVP